MPNYTTSYTCRCAITVVLVGCEAAGGRGVGRDAGTNERLPTELLELGLGGEVLCYVDVHINHTN